MLLSGQAREPDEGATRYFVGSEPRASLGQPVLIVLSLNTTAVYVRSRWLTPGRYREGIVGGRPLHRWPWRERLLWQV